MNFFKKKVIALGARLKKCRNVTTIGVKVNFYDYNVVEREMIDQSDVIYYPSIYYANLFEAFGKNIFPSYSNYNCAQDKIKQSNLFQMNNLPHPKTIFFFGKKRRKEILNYFEYPFVAKIPRGSGMGRGVFMISKHEDLDKYLEHNRIAYFQEYLPIDRDIRIVVIGGRVVHSYWRIIQSDEFRSNVNLGSKISFESIPPLASELALATARKCNWNDVGIDICQYNKRLYLLEANMGYGHKGFTSAGINYFKLMENLIEIGQI